MDKSITLIGHTMDRGGASRVLSIIANYFAKEGKDVNLVFFHVKNKYDISNEVNLIQLFNNNEKISAIKALIRIRKFLKQSNARVIISFLMPVNLLVILSTMGLNKKLIISERNDPTMSKNRIWLKLSNIFYNKADFIIFQTQRVRSYFSKSIQEKSMVIFNPVNVNIQSYTDNSKKIVNVGKLYPQKNHKLLINAFSKINRKYSDYTLHIYGEGPLRPELEKQIASLDLTDVVFLHGSCLDVHSKIANAEMFVLSSDYEGLSNALMEAMMMGIPCISTNCAGSDEIINNGVNGLLVNTGNDKKLTDAMEKLICDKELANKISKNAKTDAAFYRRGYIMSKWEEVMRKFD